MMFYNVDTDCFEMDAWEIRQQKETILKTLRVADIWERLYELDVKSIEFIDPYKMVLTIDAGAGFTYKVDIIGRGL